MTPGVDFEIQYHDLLAASTAIISARKKPPRFDAGSADAACMIDGITFIFIRRNFSAADNARAGATGLMTTAISLPKARRRTRRTFCELLLGSYDDAAVGALDLEGLKACGRGHRRLPGLETAATEFAFTRMTEHYNRRL